MGIYRFKDLNFDSDTAELKSTVEVIRLRPKSAALLQYFLLRPHQVIEKDQILADVWKGSVVGDNTLMQTVGDLRKALNDSSHSPTFIQTIPGKGYRWEIDVELGNQTIINEPSSISNISKPTVSAKVPRNYFLTSLLILFFVVAYTLKLFVNDSENKKRTIFLKPLTNMTSIDLRSLDSSYSKLLSSEINNTGILEIIEQQDADMNLAIFIVRKNERLWFKYSLLSSEGENILEGSVTSIPELVASINKKVHPKQLPTKPKLVLSQVTQANVEYTSGLAALQYDNANLAHHYFSAAVLIDPDFDWAKAALIFTYYQLGEWEDAELLLKALYLSASEITEEWQAHSLKVKAMIDYARGYLHDSEKNWNKIRVFAERTKDIRLLHLALKSLSQIKADQGRTAEYVALNSLANDILINSNDLEMYARGLYSRATIINPMFINLSKEQDLKLALSLFQQIGNKQYQASTLAALGEISTLHPNEQLTYLKSALSLFEQLSDLPQTSAIRLELASWFSREQLPELALEQLSIAQKWYAKVKHKSGINRINYYKGIAYFVRSTSSNNQNNVIAQNKARNYYETSVEGYNLFQAKFDIAAPILHQGLLSIEAKNFDVADKHLDDAISRYKQLQFPLGVLGGYFGKAYQQIKQNDLTQAAMLIEHIQSYENSEPLVLYLNSLLSYSKGNAQSALSYLAQLKAQNPSFWYHELDGLLQNLTHNKVNKSALKPIVFPPPIILLLKSG